ncbi:MAG: hypothetical protein ACTSQZ_05925, partial [Candidatus Thorarchaeota archaeon]
IIRAILYDLFGAKIWASMSFLKDGIDQELVQKAIDQYYGLIQDESAETIISLIVDEAPITLCKINDVTLLMLFYDGGDVTEDDSFRYHSLTTTLRDSVENTKIRNLSKRFEEIAREHLSIPVSICLGIDESAAVDSPSDLAMKRIFGDAHSIKGEPSSPLQIGPYSISAIRVSIDEINDGFWNDDLSNVLVIASVFHESQFTLAKIESFVSTVRKQTSSPILIIPSSDGDLDAIRNLESSTDIILCDSVSPKPSYLLLSILAMIGLSDMHPELAMKKWIVDISKDLELKPEIIEYRGSLGHQAFFVVDKMTGQAIFSYYYEAKDDFLNRSPNVIAAITMFSLDAAEDTTTSVFRTGDFMYAMIEHNNMIFTLITGQTEDEVGIRERFSFLPELWSSESLEEPRGDSESPYSAIPFTLKLLATLPPEDLVGKHSPIQLSEPVWGNFESSEVRDFLQAVWNSLDGNLQLERLIHGDGPQMTLGAILFLKWMGSIELRISIEETDIPVIIGELDDEIRKMYSHLDKITMLADGKRTLSDISTETGIQISVLKTVFQELHKRRSADFVE